MTNSVMSTTYKLAAAGTVAVATFFGTANDAQACAGQTVTTPDGQTTVIPGNCPPATTTPIGSPSTPTVSVPVDVNLSNEAKAAAAAAAGATALATGVQGQGCVTSDGGVAGGVQLLTFGASGSWNRGTSYKMEDVQIKDKNGNVIETKRINVCTSGMAALAQQARGHAPDASKTEKELGLGVGIELSPEIGNAVRNFETSGAKGFFDEAAAPQPPKQVSQFDTKIADRTPPPPPTVLKANCTKGTTAILDASGNPTFTYDPKANTLTANCQPG